MNRLINNPLELLNAFTYIARVWGVDISAMELRRRYSINEDFGIDELRGVAKEIGLELLPLSVRFDRVLRIRSVLPAIMLTDTQPLIVTEIGRTQNGSTVVKFVDPSLAEDGEAVLQADDLNRVWTGELLLIKRRYSSDDEARPFNLMWLVSQLLREKALFREIAIAGVLSTLFAITPPFLAKIIIDRVIANHSGTTLAVLMGAAGILIVFEAALLFLKNLFVQVTATRIDARLSLYTMQRLLRLPLDYFERNSAGQTLTRVNKIWQLREFLTGQVFDTFIDLIALCGLIPILFILNWQLALFVLSMGFIIFLIVLFYLPSVEFRTRLVVQAEVRKNSFLIETIHGIKTIKSLALEGRRRREWDLRTATSVQARYDLGSLINYPQALSLPFQRLTYAGSLLIGAALIVYGNDTVLLTGTLMAFALIASRVSQPLAELARLIQSMSEIRNVIAMAGELLNHPPEEDRIGTGVRLPISGDITFDNVTFRYTPTAQPALNGASFRIAAGSLVGVMGRSGSGKSTVTRLLQGLNQNYSGQIKIDGMDLREVDLNHLRTNIGVVPQENFLFGGTIRENIGMARPDASLTQIIRASQLAGADEFVERLPRGYETVLEENGSNLSGGQRQRLALARALLIDPPVLILDEATSALDAESEAIINANLMLMAKDRTIICVSHRLSMLVPADAIIVMERGEVYDVGTHTQLLGRCDIYQQLWYQQNRHVEQSPQGPVSNAPYHLPTRAS